MSTTTALLNGATTPSRRPAGRKPSTKSDVSTSPQSDTSTSSRSDASTSPQSDSSQGSDADLGAIQHQRVRLPRDQVITRFKLVTHSVSAASTSAAASAVGRKVDHVCPMNGLEVLRWLGMHDKCNIEPCRDLFSFKDVPPLQGFLSDVGFRFGGRLVRVAVTKAKATSAEAAARWLQDQLALESSEEALHIVRDACEKLANEEVCSCESDVLESECANLELIKADTPLLQEQRERYTSKECVKKNDWRDLSGAHMGPGQVVAFLTAPTSVGGVGLSVDSSLIKRVQQCHKKRQQQQQQQQQQDMDVARSMLVCLHTLSSRFDLSDMMIGTSRGPEQVLADMASGRAQQINMVRVDCGATLEEALRIAAAVQYGFSQVSLMPVVVTCGDVDDADDAKRGDDEHSVDRTRAGSAVEGECEDHNDDADSAAAACSVVSMRTDEDEDEDEDEDAGDADDDEVKHGGMAEISDSSTHESGCSVGDKRKAEHDGPLPEAKRQRTNVHEAKQSTDEMGQRVNRSAKGGRKQAFHVLQRVDMKDEGAKLLLLRDAFTGVLCMARAGVEQAEWDVWSHLLRLGDAEDHGIVPVLGRAEHSTLGRVIVMPLLREFRSTVVQSSDERERDIAGQLCSAVAYLHDNLVLHCNLSVENILSSWDRSRFFLSDFGSSILLPRDRSARAVRYRKGGWTYPYASKNRMRGAREDAAGTAGDGDEHRGEARAVDDWHALCVVGWRMMSDGMRADLSHWRSHLVFKSAFIAPQQIMAFARDRLKKANEDETSHRVMRGELPWDAEEKKRHAKKKKKNKAKNKKNKNKNKKKKKMKKKQQEVE